MTYKEFAVKYNLKLHLTRMPFRIGDEDTEWDSQAKHFAYSISVTEGERFGKKMTGQYSQGSGIKGAPSIIDILNSLNSDTQGIDQTSFELWAQDFGYDTDSRKAFNIYQACLKEAQQLKEVLGSKGMEELHEIESL